MKKKKCLGILLLAAMLVLGNRKFAYAAETDDMQARGAADDDATDASMLQISVAGDEVFAYVECNKELTKVEAQIAMYPCENVQVEKGKDVSVHTIIMLDNSLSVTEENREKIKAVLRQYVENIPEQEVVSLATFGEDMQFLCKESRDTKTLLSLVDGIEFHNQDTFLTDFLYQTLEEIKNDTDYTRFIVISDGVDNKAVGITKEELHDKLQNVPRPVYTIGHDYKDNAEQLKNMFALSRMTGGKNFYMEEIEDFLSIADEIHDFSDTYSCRMKIPQDVMDGANRHVLLKLHTQNEIVEVTGEAPMPFGLIEKKETEDGEEGGTAPAEEEPPVKEQETVSQSTLSVEPVSQKEPESAVENTVDDAQSGSGNIAALVLIPVIIIAVFLLFKQQKKQKAAQKTKEENEKKGRKKKVPEKGKVQKKPEIQVLQEAPEILPVPEVEEEGTVLLERRYLLVLRDQADPEKIFRYPLDRPVVVGRNVDRAQIAVDYSLTVSGRHCEFFMKNGHFFIGDLNSANHTYLNGTQINGEREVMSGNRIRLGEVEFAVEIVPL